MNQSLEMHGVIGSSLPTRLNRQPQSIAVSGQNNSERRRRWAAPTNTHPDLLLFASLLKNAPWDSCLLGR